MRTTRSNDSRVLLAARQAGVALVFALIGLVVLTLGAVALIRSVDTGVLALGNLSFKQSALQSGARGADDAMDWLAANMNSGLLDADQRALGYYASSQDTLDPTGRSLGTGGVQALVDWNADGCKVNGSNSGAAACLTASAETTVNGDKVRYIITRMCNQAGSLDAPGSTVVCLVPPIPTELQTQGAEGGEGYPGPDNNVIFSYNPYYRVITRTVGPKGTVSFTETMAHF